MAFNPVTYAPSSAGFEHPPLEAQDVHLWFVRTNEVPPASYQALYDLLDAEERERAAAFYHDRDRITSVVTRGLLRRQLAHYDNRQPHEIQFSMVGNGKPALADSDIQFNVSHSGDRVLLGFSRAAEIGVDIEDPERDLDDLLDISENFFAPGERQLLRTLPATELRRGFFNCWTRKEAFIKVYGEGLSRDLNSFEVELRPDHPPRVLVVDGSPATASEFTLFAADPDPQTIAAVCLPRAPRQVQAYRWNGLLR